MKVNTILVIGVILIFTACNTTSEEKPELESKEVVTVLSASEKEVAIAKGKEIAQNTFKVLGGNLKQAMGEGGVENAINFCNANVSHLMDSISKHYNATIRRTSNKLRNGENAPSVAEQGVLDMYLNGGEMKPVVELLANGNTAFYAPIKMKPLCISCHGTVGESLNASDYEVIKNHYPADEATDYAEGDFRGIWSIELKK